MERKKKPSPGRALAKLGYIRRKGEAAVERVRDNVSLDTDRYNTPEEYAENELFEIANDSIEAGKDTGRKAKERIKRRIRKKLENREKKDAKREKRLEKSRSSKTSAQPAEKPTSEYRSPFPSNGSQEVSVRSSASEPKAGASSKQSAYSLRARHPHAAKGTAQSAEKSTQASANAWAKTAQQTAKLAEKSAEAAKVTAEKSAQAAKVAAERSAQVAKAAAQAAAKAAEALAKYIAEAAKAAAEAVKELIAAIAAGGWVSVVVIAVIAVVALLVCSAFGVFATEDLTGCKPMSEIVAEISSEYHERMKADALAVDMGSYDALAISYMGDGDGDAPVNNWNDVIAVFAVYCSTNPDDAMNVIELTDISIDYIRRIFYEMNWYDLSTHGRYDEGEEMWVLTVYVNQHSLNYREAADHFEFTDYQREILYEMMKPEYCSYYARLMGISVSGDANVNDILALLPGGKGGDVARAAISKLGAPYVLGAKGDDKFDCSGLVCWAINQVDPDLGAHFWARAADQAFYCHINDMEIEQSELQPGDLVFWQNRQCSGCGRWNEVHHTGIYIGLGMVIEASSSKGRVVIRDLWSTYNYPIYMFARPYS
ncbi:MAG: C40 family peptidase [Clostridia bacterium]|nr:C40 family peptidase [Clostridia bacterium]